MALLKINNTVYFMDRVACYRVINGVFEEYFKFDTELDSIPFPVRVDKKNVLVTGNKFIILEDIDKKSYSIIEHNSNFDIVCDAAIIEDVVYLSCADGIHLIKDSTIIKTKLSSSAGFITLVDNKLYYYAFDPVYRYFMIKSCEIDDDLQPIEATETIVQKVDSYLDSHLEIEGRDTLMIAKSPFGCCFGSVNSSDYSFWRPGRHLTQFKVSEFPHYINRNGFVEGDRFVFVPEKVEELELKSIDLTKL